ncbi:hypothetical protein F4775DRAFT_600123 [Biscogniauxia sp. FL1348]|nr:hypothetical protein F4775DRAFT_600123 [Biscogniauxia sp. FL1348]
MSQQLSIRIPSRSGSPAPATASSQKSDLQLQFADILIRVTGTTTKSREAEDDDNDDACSSYDEDEAEDQIPEADTADSPDSYAEFAFLNPYTADASSQGNPGGLARVVCQTVKVPVRAESHEEALSRLSSQLDSMHSVIRAEESAALRFLRTLFPGDEEAEEVAI